MLDFDFAFMGCVLALSEKQLGQTWPNPCVGCIIVKNNQIIGRGVTARGGRPHAETIALEQAGALARAATAYVTLEPCAHHGKTPPCVDALIASGIKRVVMATTDPDPRVSGQGIARLKDAGIEVIVGACREHANDIHAGFFKTIHAGLPLVALKLAATRNGFLEKRTCHPERSEGSDTTKLPGILRSTQDNKYITSAQARDHTHFLRAQYDAILVGIGTVLADDPVLNVRLVGYEHRSPLRIILDRQMRIPMDSKIVQTASQYRTVIVTEQNNHPKAQSLIVAGIQIIAMDIQSLESVLRKLVKDLGLTRLFIEGGYRIAQSVIREGLADKIYWYRNHYTASPQAKYNVQDLGFEPQPYFLDYSLDSIKTFASDELRVYTKCSLAL